jgi:hypothetical protein
LTFAPQSSGAASATLFLISNAGNGAAETLTGNGIAPPPPPEHSVSLSWTGSGSEVVAYNVYRGNSAGGPYTKIGSALDTTGYVDNAVLAGQAYCYVATALDGNGRESSYSNEVQVVIPTP